jgi:hypothetical protein
MTPQTMTPESVRNDVKESPYAGVVENERTAEGQKLTRQPDGPGKRIGVKGEISGIGKLAPGGARLFRERLPQIQAEAGYWETRVGTVQELRVTLIDNDTRILFTIVYDGDFKPYVEDFLREAGPWLSTRSFSAYGMVSEAITIGPRSMSCSPSPSKRTSSS